MLKIVEPFVCYGFPTVGTVRELVFKKGYAILGGKKVNIETNKLVEDNLGSHGVICLEDMIHELSSVGDKFEYVAKFLGPFQVIIFFIVFFSLKLMIELLVGCSKDWLGEESQCELRKRRSVWKPWQRNQLFDCHLHVKTF